MLRVSSLSFSTCVILYLYRVRQILQSQRKYEQEITNVSNIIFTQLESLLCDPMKRSIKMIGVSDANDSLTCRICEATQLIRTNSGPSGRGV